MRPPDFCSSTKGVGGAQRKNVGKDMGKHYRNTIYKFLYL